MSSPYVAGGGALPKQKHPTWTPAMIKSSLMTTANDLHGTFNATAGPPITRHGGGVGRCQPGVRPGRWPRPADAAVDPGSSTTTTPWTAPLHLRDRPAAGLGVRAVRRADRSERPQPGVDHHRRHGGRSDRDAHRAERRQLATETYSVEFSGLPGITCLRRRRPFSRSTRASRRTVNITFTRTDAAFNVYQSGFMTLDQVRRATKCACPVAIRPVAVLGTGSR